MRCTKRNIRICVVLLILNVLFIWGNSLLPANISAAFSGFVKKILEYILPIGEKNPELSHGLLRKIAHFMEFASLGALSAWLYIMLPERTVFLLPCGIVVAGVDEFIQRFVPGRSASFTDVLIDSSGVLFGVCVVLILRVLVSGNNRKDKLGKKGQR